MKGLSKARGTAYLTKKFAQGSGFDKFCKFVRVVGVGGGNSWN